MPEVLVATDADRVFDEIDAALSGEHSMTRVHTGAEVLPLVEDHAPDLVVLDLQIGNMGGIATCLDLRLEQNADRVDDFAVLILLDRADDMFLAREADADGWLVKPMNSIRLRNAARVLLDGGDYFEGLLREESDDADSPVEQESDPGTN